MQINPSESKTRATDTGLCFKKKTEKANGKPTIGCCVLCPEQNKNPPKPGGMAAANQTTTMPVNLGYRAPGIIQPTNAPFRHRRGE